MTKSEMLHNFRMLPSPTPTQLLGEAIAAYGHIDGMLYVSPAVTNATNLVIVEHSLEILGGSIEVHEENVYDCLP
jgi:hypothetical protein